jgi:hypothetical protein
MLVESGVCRNNPISNWWLVIGVQKKKMLKIDLLHVTGYVLIFNF